MTALQNGRVDGAMNGFEDPDPTDQHTSNRFSDIPFAIDIPVSGEDDDQAVEVDLIELTDDTTEICILLENENAARQYWMTVALAYAKQMKVDHAIEILNKGNQVLKNSGQKEKLSMLSCLCWMFLWKSREAPRVAPEGVMGSEAKTKEYYLQLSTATLNEASRINPAFPPLFLARGVLQLLKASLQPPSKAANPQAIDTDKAEILRNALKSFEDAIRVSAGRNIMALLGKARTQYSLGRYPESLESYQEALHRMPDLVDPDPRIGIGCCLWQLGFKDDAKVAWERSLDIDPDSKIANILLGLFHLDASAHVPTNGTEFIRLYKIAMTEYTQKAFKADKDLPLTCATFAGYFLSRKSLSNVDALAHKAIHYTDVNAIASDGWYLLARKEHYSKNFDRANDYYKRADEARGGIDRGYLPAKFGAAQLFVLKGDYGEAKLRLEKIIQQSKSVEAMTLLGTLYAEEVFTNQQTAVKEDKSTELKKAIGYLETVRTAWKDTKKRLIPDASVLLNLARLYEVDQPEKSLQCLQQVEQLEYDQVAEQQKPKTPEEETALRSALREHMPPQLFNNIGCFYYQSEKFDRARAMFQVALSACVKVGEKQEDMDSDALVTTISFNLGRTYEASGSLDEANTVYKGLLERHQDYVDARTRLAYISLRQNPAEDGPKTVLKLYQETFSDLEVRALYGWYLGRVHSRKRAPNIAEDPELRHYKHTLQSFDKHDRYALIGMGNLYLQTAREMLRETDQDKEKRSNMYTKAVEFFEKALQLDPKNAYAAQGIAIALVEDKKDYKTGLSIFIKVRDTVKDPSVFVNLGHTFAELRQYSKAIEHYEAALLKDRGRDAQILACLGRTWLAKGKAEKSLQSFKIALDYAQKALEIAPEQVHFKFNIAFVQIQLATTIYALSDTQRTLLEVQEAATGLEEAIESLETIAQHHAPPYPKHDIEQRANMARNTMRKQLDRAVQAQKDYEEKNAEKLQAAKLAREEDLRKREEDRESALRLERERKAKIQEERQKMAEQDRELAEQRMEEERAREAAEMTTDEETGEKIKRKKGTKSGGRGGKRKKKNEEGITDDEESGTDRKRGSRSASEKPKKKRRLAKKAEKPTKFKSSEIVVDSDSEGDNGVVEAQRAMEEEEEDKAIGEDKKDDGMDIDGSEEDEVADAVGKKRTARRAVSEESENEDDDLGGRDIENGSPTMANGDGDEEVADAIMARKDDEQGGWSPS